jgi:glucokinase
MMDKIAIGVDIGGTKINIAAVNYQGQILEVRTIKTPAQNKKQLLTVLIDNLRYFDNKYEKIEGIGIATAGRVIFF